MRAAKFTLDPFGNEVFDGFTLGERWNGWACPLPHLLSNRVYSRLNKPGLAPFIFSASTSRRMIQTKDLKAASKKYIEEYFGNMPPVRISLVDPQPNPFHPKSHYMSKRRKIEIDRDFIARASDEAIQDCLKHELTHAWIDWKGLRDKGPQIDEHHNEHFIGKAYSVGCDVQYLAKDQKSRQRIREITEHIDTYGYVEPYTPPSRVWWEIKNAALFIGIALLSVILAIPRALATSSRFAVGTLFLASITLLSLILGLVMLAKTDRTSEQHRRWNTVAELSVGVSVMLALWSAGNFIMWLAGD